MITVMLALAALQDPESLRVVAEPSGDELRVRGRVDLPDGTELTVTALHQREEMLHNRKACQLVTSETAGDSRRTAIREGMFEVTLRGARVDAIRIVGEGCRARRLIGDPRSAVTAMWDERRTLKDALSEVRSLAEACHAKRGFASIEERVVALERRLAAVAFVGKAAPEIIVGALAKMRGLNEGGGPREDSPEIPEGVNEQWQVDLMDAYVVRAGRTVAREPLVVALRYAREAWEAALVAGRRTDAWVAARGALRASAALVESEQASLAGASRCAMTLADTMDRAIGGDATEAREVLDALDTELRTIPSR